MQPVDTGGGAELAATVEARADAAREAIRERERARSQGFSRVARTHHERMLSPAICTHNLGRWAELAKWKHENTPGKTFDTLGHMLFDAQDGAVRR